MDVTFTQKLANPLVYLLMGPNQPIVGWPPVAPPVAGGWGWLGICGHFLGQPCTAFQLLPACC
jgi:hypothetical protein